MWWRWRVSTGFIPAQFGGMEKLLMCWLEKNHIQGEYEPLVRRPALIGRYGLVGLYFDGLVCNVWIGWVALTGQSFWVIGQRVSAYWSVCVGSMGRFVCVGRSVDLL